MAEKTTGDTMQAADFRAFCAISLVLSWGVGGLYLVARRFEAGLPVLDGHSPVFALTCCAPSLAAMMVVGRRSGLAGLRDLVLTVFRPFYWAWLAVSILLFPVLVWVLSLGAAWLHLSWPVAPDAAFRVMPVALLTTPVLFANIAPVGEEFGWRGFALPYLLKRRSPLVASLILGVIRLVWHLPAFGLGGMMVTPLADLGWWALGEVALTAVMTGLYLRARGNLLVAGIVPHAVVNALGRLGDWTSRPAEALAMVVCAAIALAPIRRALRRGDDGL